MTRLLPDIRPTETYTETNFLRVHTFPSRGNTTIRLASIEHLYYGPDTQQPTRYAWQCRTVVESEPMTQDDAVFIASSYAKDNDIPVVYECHSDVSEQGH